MFSKHSGSISVCYSKWSAEYSWSLLSISYSSLNGSESDSFSQISSSSVPSEDFQFNLWHLYASLLPLNVMVSFINCIHDFHPKTQKGVAYAPVCTVHMKQRKIPSCCKDKIILFNYNRVRNCAFLVANATENFALATRISQLVARGRLTTLFHATIITQKIALLFSQIDQKKNSKPPANW